MTFTFDKNAKEALKFTKKSKKYSAGDGTWRYNEAFLLMYLGQFKEAIIVYRKICNTSYLNEEDTLRQVYKFNEELYISDNSQLQSLYIIGYLKYKKENNYPAALDYFDTFIQNINGHTKFKLLKSKAQSYKSELERLMQLK